MRSFKIKKTSSINTGGDNLPAIQPGVEEVEKKGKFKRSGHLTDQMLKYNYCLLYTSPSPRDRTRSRMPSSA